MTEAEKREARAEIIRLVNAYLHGKSATWSEILHACRFAGVAIEIADHIAFTREYQATLYCTKGA